MNSSRKIHNFLAQYRFEGIFGFVCAYFPKSKIRIYPNTYVELKYGTCNLKSEVSDHRLGLVVQLS